MNQFVSRIPVAIACAVSAAGVFGLERGLEKAARVLHPSLFQEVAPTLLERLGGVKAVGGACLGSLSVAGVAYWLLRKKTHIFVDKPFCHESVVSDSVEEPVRPPPCQVWIGYPSKDGNIEVVGSGMRVQFGAHFLMTAGHNLAFDDDIYLIKGANVARVGAPHVVSVGTDVALLPVPESLWSTLGVKVAVFSPVPAKGMVHVQVCGRNSFGTHGYLTSGPGCVGELVYSATTKAGYSGAPYFSGNHVYGMHTHGGRRNGGYSAMYLSALCKMSLQIELESDYNFTWYKRLYGKSRENPSVQMFGDKAVVMNDDGHAYVLDKTKFEEFELRLKSELGREMYEGIEEEEDEYDEECFPPSLNFRRPGLPRASNSLDISPALEGVQSELKRMAELLRPTATSSRKRARRSRNASRLLKNTASPTSPQQRLNAPSTSMRRGEPSQ